MSPRLTYGPAYIGLYAALVLGIACNAFLDIRNGTFGFEVFFWAVVFAYTLRVGWKQQGSVGEVGRARQKIVLLVGSIMSVLVFLPIWGLPVGGLYVLAALQAAMNCVTVTRRNLLLGLLVSLIMVLFAAAEASADWTMLFYLLPYIVAVVFTLVSEQIARRTQDIRREGLGLASAGGRGAAIAVATATILGLGGLLYAATPHMSITHHLYWKYGQPGRTGQIGNTLEARDGSGFGQGTGNDGGAGQTSLNGLPTVAQMREAAGRPGMPSWQSSAIVTLADFVEVTAEVLRPIDLGLDELKEGIKKWLKEHLDELLSILLTLILLAIAIATWLLLREARVMLWLRARFDYIVLALLRRHATGSRGVLQYYTAMERLYDLHDLKFPEAANAREYMRLVAHRFAHLQHEATEATVIFERARYGKTEATPTDIYRMRALYLRIHRLIDQIALAY